MTKSQIFSSAGDQEVEGILQRRRITHTNTLNTSGTNVARIKVVNEASAHNRERTLRNQSHVLRKPISRAG